MGLLTLTNIWCPSAYIFSKEVIDLLSNLRGKDILLLLHQDDTMQSNSMLHKLLASLTTVKELTVQQWIAAH